MSEYRSIPENPVDLIKKFQLIWEHRRLIFIFTLVGILTAFIILSFNTKNYKVTTDIYLTNKLDFFRFQSMNAFLNSKGYEFNVNEKTFMKFFVREFRDSQEVSAALLNNQIKKGNSIKDEPKRANIIKSISKSFQIELRQEDLLLSFNSQDLSLAKELVKQAINFNLDKVKEGLILNLNSILENIENDKKNKLSLIDRQLAILEKYPDNISSKKQLEIAKTFYEVSEDSNSLVSAIKFLESTNHYNWLYYDLDMAKISGDKSQRLVYLIPIFCFLLGIFYVFISNALKQKSQ